jgi:hypothetical protein
MYIHALVNGTPRGKETHHIDGDSLNNRRANLMTLTTKQHRQIDSCKGSKAHPNNRTGRRGVSQMPNGRYRALFSNRTLGYYDDLEEAARVAAQHREWVAALRTNAYSA